jgi:hypothetical protein
LHGAARPRRAARAPDSCSGTQSISSERRFAFCARRFPPKALRDLQEEYLKNGRLFASMNVRVESDSSYTVVVDEGAPARVCAACTSPAHRIFPRAR